MSPRKEMMGKETTPVKLLRYDGDQQIEVSLRTSDQPSDTISSDEQLISRFANWLKHRGSQSISPSPFNVYNHNPSDMVLLQDEERTVSDDDMSGEGSDELSDNDMSDEPLEDDIPDNAELPPRVVDGAHLVYKRKGDEGTYEELWIYNVTPSSTENMKIKDKILAGTDIEPTKTQSEDGTQRYDFWAVGNAHMINITGLPN